MPEYISIADFAERAGVTKQAVYKRVDKDLKPYVEVVDGRKVLHINALRFFQSTDSTKAVEQRLPISPTDELIQHIKLDNDRLSNQLTTTVDMLQASQGENRKLTEQLVKITDDFAELAKQSNTLLSQQQSLQGHMQQQAASRQTTVDAHVNEVDKNVNVSAATVDTGQTSERGNWFTRIFK